MLRGSDSIAEGVSRVKVRIQDIAERVGVSSATVSNALNGRGGVGETKLKQILSLAREMGYVFERNSLNNKDYIRLVIFKRHGLVVMDTQFFAEILEHMTREAKQNGYELLVTHINMEKDQDYLKQINEICMEDCAGIILLATEMFSEDLRLFAHTKAPLLVLDSMFRHDNYNCVVMNNYEAGYIAGERLIAMGHTSIEHITASVRFNNMRDRRKGFQAAMVAHDIALPEDFLWQVTPTVEGAETAAAHRLLHRQRRDGRGLRAGASGEGDQRPQGCFHYRHGRSEHLPGHQPSPVHHSGVPRGHQPHRRPAAGGDDVPRRPQERAENRSQRHAGGPAEHPGFEH